MPQPTDIDQRQAATDPGRSFIVQAPAGSGKTALLTQRYLRLLATVEVPEEILAITFTRKAAGEMRERIIEALARAGEDDPPESEHEAETWTLARAARARDRELGWGLERHPARMRVQTMDSFNAALTRQLPLLSGLGAQPGIADDARELYEAAARSVIENLESGASWSESIAGLLLHLDNRIDKAEGMLADMLARRDQWLERLLSDQAGDRQGLEAAIAAEAAHQLERAHALIPGRFHAELAELAAGAASNLKEQQKDSPILACAGLDALPGPEPEQLEVWLGLVELLLTRSGSWRSSVDKRIGFPPDRKDAKQHLSGLIEQLGDIEGLDSALDRLRGLPPLHYDESQWALLEGFRELLPLAVAQLQVVFRERGEVDHNEIALRAIQALGEDEQPTDLALALDYRISHVLVDEFQDTSTRQFRLLQALTRGWTPGDGRSLFLVGDPMQSIYRFREAEVGLFLRARSEGLRDLPLVPLRLEVNFRSRAPLVDWVNRGFPDLLAAQEDPASGAVPFEPAEAFDAAGSGGIGVHPQIGESSDRVREAQAVAELAGQRLSETEEGTVAILVRGRAQAAEILPALRRAGLSYQSVDLESLASRPVVQDLLALTRALAHEGDRAAWLAVLRAPWCGLSLADLHLLFGDAGESGIREILDDPERIGRLSDDGRRRLGRILGVLESARVHRRRDSLRHRVETTWLALGGPATVDGEVALADANAFLELLESLEEAGDLDDVNELDEALSGLYAQPDPEGNPRLQIMTIHKAKGLEFDTVILPGLDSGTGRDDPPLLQWMERPRLGQEPDLLLAPIQPAGMEDKDPHHAFIRELAKEKDDHEQARLLYVAVTRAVRRLELFAHAKAARNRDGEWELRSPTQGSLLARLWPLVQQDFHGAFERWLTDPGQATAEAEAVSRELRRLPLGWQLPEPDPPVAWEGGVTELDTDSTAIEFEWAGETARVVGNVVHRFLQQIAEDGLAQWNREEVEARRPAIRAMLSGLGADPGFLDAAEERTVRALCNTLDDETGRWILDDHAEAASELALTAWSETGPATQIIDRSFVDEAGVRWIIDYKTGYREGGDVEGFLDQEAERYAQQLDRYRKLAEAMDDRPTRLALYFPLMGRLREVDPREGGEEAGRE